MVEFHGFVGSSKSTREDEENDKKKKNEEPFRKTEREDSNYWMIRLVGLAYRCTCYVYNTITMYFIF